MRKRIRKALGNVWTRCSNCGRQTQLKPMTITQATNAIIEVVKNEMKDIEAINEVLREQNIAGCKENAKLRKQIVGLRGRRGVFMPTANGKTAEEVLEILFDRADTIQTIPYKEHSIALALSSIRALIREKMPKEIYCHPAEPRCYQQGDIVCDKHRMYNDCLSQCLQAVDLALGGKDD